MLSTISRTRFLYSFFFTVVVVCSKAANINVSLCFGVVILCSGRERDSYLIAPWPLPSTWLLAASFSYLCFKRVWSSSSHRCFCQEFLRARLWITNTGYNRAYLVRCGVCFRLGSSGLDPVNPEEQLPSVHKSCRGAVEGYTLWLGCMDPRPHFSPGVWIYLWYTPDKQGGAGGQHKCLTLHWVIHTRSGHEGY